MNVTLGTIVIAMQSVQILLVVMIVNVWMGFLVMAMNAMMKSRVLNSLLVIHNWFM